MPVTDWTIDGYEPLGGMYDDPFFPDHLVDRGKAILHRLSTRIAAAPPADLTALYALTAAATEEFNALEAAFDEAGSELETVAREEIGEAFHMLALAHGYQDADPEKLIAARDW
ncbi:DUF5713 family protein [Streptomyces uncialis]|uniref:Uncharacterized protein n=1 Tax=Streptomyces uncialis TaxID=1048205 RepID=A0A1Q4VDV3_9ACTN|nr:DUF5713 family protein [Streptomyces uncialis]OKH96013.1 hypothetical protein AB852_04840 [Streptomyces uncialis]WST68714.1 DUF5713 family protein [Streptomyces uncialis]WTE12656.1 DUF5713 family protein [Streptomyces uncialis]